MVSNDENVRKTTEEELSKLAEHLKAKSKVTCDNDDNIPFDSNDSTSDDSSDDEFIPRKQQSVLSASDRIYVDNQKLWTKISKVTAVSERLEEKLHFIKLDLNNSHIDCTSFQKENDKLSTFIIAQNKKVKHLKSQLHIYYVYNIAITSYALILWTEATFGIDIIHQSKNYLMKAILTM